MKYKREYFFCERLTDKILPITAKRFHELAEQQFGKKIENNPIPVAFNLTQKKEKRGGGYEITSEFSAFTCISPISEEVGNVLGERLEGIIRDLILELRKQMIPIIKEELEKR